MDVIKKASLTVFDANSVRATTILDSADGTRTTLILEYVKPDRVRVVQSDGAERIAIKGKGFWSKSGDKWENQGAQGADFFFAFLEPSALEESLKIIEVNSVQFAGIEMLDARPMFVYNYGTTLDMGTTKVKGTGKMWIGAVDGRAYKGESFSDSIANPGKQDHTIVKYEYDIPLSIQEPQ